LFKSSAVLNVKSQNAVVIFEATIVSLTCLEFKKIWYINFNRSKFNTIKNDGE